MKIGNIARIVGKTEGPQNSLRRHLVRGFKGSAILFVLQKLSIFLLAIALGRFLGAEGLGVYSTAMAIILIMGTVVEQMSLILNVDEFVRRLESSSL